MPMHVCIQVLQSGASHTTSQSAAERQPSALASSLLLADLLQRAAASEKVCLFHDPQELFLIDLTISIAVRLVDHLLELLVGHALTQLLGNALQVLEGDLAGLIVVKQTESLQDLVLRVAIPM